MHRTIIVNCSGTDPPIFRSDTFFVTTNLASKVSSSQPDLNLVSSLQEFYLSSQSRTSKMCPSELSCHNDDRSDAAVQVRNKKLEVMQRRTNRTKNLLENEEVLAYRGTYPITEVCSKFLRVNQDGLH